MEYAWLIGALAASMGGKLDAHPICSTPTAAVPRIALPGRGQGIGMRKRDVLERDFCSLRTLRRIDAAQRFLVLHVTKQQSICERCPSLASTARYPSKQLRHVTRIL
jgi:hypothetical protein